MVTKHGAYCQGQGKINNHNQQQDLNKLFHMVFSEIFVALMNMVK